MDDPAWKPLIVYGHDQCGQSLWLKQTLRDNNVDNEWRDVLNGDPQYQVDVKKLAQGYLSVLTVIFPDGTVMVEPFPSQVLNCLQPRQPNLVERLLGRD